MSSEIIFNGTLSNDKVRSLGANRIFESDVQSISQSETAIEVVVRYDNQLPDPETAVARYSLTAILEEEVGEGVWRPFFTQGTPFLKTEQGNTVIFVYGPNIFNFDDSVGFDMSDGTSIIAKEYRKQGNLPSRFRAAIVVNQQVALTDIASFQSVDVNVSFKTYSV